MIAAPAQVLPAIGQPALAWAALAAVGIPIAIHLLAQMRRTVMPWAAMRFITEAIRRHRRRLRLEQWLLLITRCLLVLVAGLAIAGMLVRGAWFGSAGTAPRRHVVIILDDSLTSRVRGAGQTTRFQSLRDEALDVLNALQGDDMFAILRAGHPSGALIEPWSTDIDGARRALKGLEPGHGVSQLAQAVEMARKHAAALDRGARVTVFVLSDLAHGALGTAGPVPAEGPNRAEVTWCVRRPESAVDNQQIEAFHPRRPVVVADEDGRTTMPFTVTLRRFTADAQAEETAVRVASGGSSVQILHRWREGQRLSPPLPVVLPMTTATGRGVHAVTAAITAPNRQRLQEDDRRHCLVEVRSKLFVGIVDAVEASETNAIAARRWITAALAPNADGLMRDRDRVEVTTMNASELTAARCRGLDAVIVLRPDRIGAEGYTVLHEAASRGTMIVAIAPPSMQPAVWGEALCRAMGLDWRVGLDALMLDPPLALAGNLPVPAPFEEVATDWEALLRPVRVSRTLVVAPGDGPATVWLALDDAAHGRRPLVLAGDVGAGRFVLCAAALDESWSNLPTKPLWVPFLHEMVRSAAGGVGAANHQWLCGDQPVLDAAWRTARRLRHADVSVPREIALRGDAAGGLTTETPLPVPGIYVGDPGGGPHLIVNVPADGGDTRASGADVVERWFDAMGSWQWLDPQAPATALEADEPWRDLTLTLLAAALALAVLETGLARWFSHPAPRVPEPAGGVAHG